MNTIMEKNMHVIAGYKLSNQKPTRDSLKLTEMPVPAALTVDTNQYLTIRGISIHTALNCPNVYPTANGLCFMLYGPGLAYQERLMRGIKRFNNPIHLALGKYVFYAGEPYFSNSPLFVTEGVTDALAVWQEGYTSVALLGTAVTVERAELILRLGIGKRTLVIPDNDAAGYSFLASINNYLAVWHAGVRYLPSKYKDFCEMPVEFRAEWLKRAI